LLPKVRAAGVDDLIMANGFSCQEQIAMSDRHALHLAQVFQIAWHSNPVGDGYPEAPWVRARQAAVNRAMRRSAIALGGAATLRIYGIGNLETAAAGVAPASDALALGLGSAYPNFGVARESPPRLLAPRQLPARRESAMPVNRSCARPTIKASLAHLAATRR
jgi:hypothetical protein